MAKTEVFEDARPTNDAWTGMLAISLLALIVGCVLLYLDFSQYPTKEPPPIQKVQINAPAPGNPPPAPLQQPKK